MTYDLHSRFANDGYIHLPDRLTKSQVNNVTAVVRDIFTTLLTSSAPSALKLSNILRADKEPLPSADGEYSFQVEHAFRQRSELRAFAHSDLTRSLLILADQMPALLFDDQCYLKPSLNGGPTYLHRDSDFFGPLRITTIWIPLTPTDDRSGCLWFIPGSHLIKDHDLGIRRRTSAPQTDLNADRGLDFFYEFDPKIVRPVPVACNPGDVVMIHRDVLHVSMSNHSNQERYSYLMEFMPEEDLLLHRASHPGVFEYHDRVNNMLLVS